MEWLILIFFCYGIFSFAVDILRLIGDFVCKVNDNDARGKQS